MSGTKTGDGGFEIDGKTYVYDVGPLDSPGVDPIATDKGDINVDGSKKDISKKTKETLGKYLKSVTKSNYFPIDGNNPGGSTDVALTDPVTGVPTPLASGPENVPQFSDPKSDSGVTADSPGLRLSTTTVVSDPATKLSGLSKGKKAPKGIDGNALLPGVTSKASPEPVKQYTSAVLSNNRFTDASMAADFNKNVALGSPDFLRPGNDYNTSFNVHGSNKTLGELAQVGSMLSLRGSQEFPAAFKDDVNPTGAGSVAGALLPSPNQLGILKINTRILEARDALDKLSGEVSNDAQVSIAPIGHQSWGALNNVEEPFAGLLNVGMVALALAMQATLLLAFEGLGALLSIGSGPPVSTKTDPSTGLYFKGRSTNSALADPSNVGFPPNFQALLGLRGTAFPFGQALKVGTAAFFVGADKAQEGVGSQLLGALASAATNALADNSSAGFIIVTSRTIVRAGQAVAADAEKIGKAFASNPISGIKSIVSLLDNLRHSKLIAAMNVFAGLGDAILSVPTNQKVTDLTGQTIISRIDTIHPDSVDSAVQKNRLVGETSTGVPPSSKIAWRSSRAPSVYLLPPKIANFSLQAADKLGGFGGVLGLQDSAYSKTYTADQKNGRLTSEAVEAIEASLDAEYVPFSFHDLRTNEIISFHAFLAALNDDYNANWESVDGFGRVDQVRIYKSTARRIGLSFYAAALDEDDFHDMWVKLNKLVTMVYPQYTRGRQLATDDNTQFVQPFSQMMGSSPVIRIRLGDLLRSNYSRFALARLFGAADGDMQIGGTTVDLGDDTTRVTEQRDQLGSDVVTKAIADALTNPSVGKKYMLSTPSGVLLRALGSSPRAGDLSVIDSSDLQYLRFSVKGVDKSSNTVDVEPEIASTVDIHNELGLSTSDAQRKVDDLKKRYDADANQVTSAVYTVPIEKLAHTQSTRRDALSNLASSVKGIDTLADFMRSDKNALVKSFKSVQGKGLAGVIESLGFDWYDRVTWETKGSKAPKMCRITIAFAPMHDISPGLDSQGYNRAPVYPVGFGMANRRDRE